MKLLALELSSPEGSIAWSDDEEELFSTTFANDRRHSGAFFENLRACLARFGNPARIVVGLGPGSYAGTRIAIAAATGLAAANGAELAGAASLCAIAIEATEYVAIGDARRQSFWFAHVREREAQEGPLLCSAEELQERLRGLDCPVVASEALAVYPEAVIAHPSAAILTQCAVQITPEPLEPIYLRAPHITYPKPR